MAKQQLQVMAHPLIAVVCDIRGFTDFTSSVDAVNTNELVPWNDKVDLWRDYDHAVVQTQDVAIRTLLGPLTQAFRDDKDLRNAWTAQHVDTDQGLPCAMKSTGDGFLVAVNLALNDVPYGDGLKRKFARYLTVGLLQLVEAAKEPNGDFRKTLITFFRIWKDYLAIRLEPETFRVAGAMALGTGAVSTEEDVPGGWRLAKVVRLLDRNGGQGSLCLKSDAYGHGVNLAFRLCDRAGRKKDDPYVLLDRRIGQLLLEKQTDDGAPSLNFRTKNRRVYALQLACAPVVEDAAVAGYALQRVSFETPLKGIDELWCYGLKKDENKVKLLDETRTARIQGVETQVEFRAWVRGAEVAAAATSPPARTPGTRKKGK